MVVENILYLYFFNGAIIVVTKFLPGTRESAEKCVIQVWNLSEGN